MRRWVCPQCGGGVNGLDRPRRDDVRRYCLGCSAKTGRLVERSCPALEKQRAVSTERVAAKANRKRDREREAAKARLLFGDLDLQAEAQRLWRLPVMKEQRAWRERLPEMEIRRSKVKHYTSGHSWGSRICITIGTAQCSSHVREVLLHELVHCVLPGFHHNETFYRVQLRAAREAWPHVEFPPMPPKLTKWEKGEFIRAALAAGEAS